MTRPNRSNPARSDSIGGRVIVLPPGVPPITRDALSLSDFVSLKPRISVLDMGCGSLCVSMRLLARQGGLKICAIDDDPVCAAAARKNAEDNGLDIEVFEADWSAFEHEPFDLAVCNPPYLTGEGSRAKHADDLSGAVNAAARLTRFRGRAAFVVGEQRLADLIACMVNAKLQPKRLLLANSLALVEAVRGGKPGGLIVTVGD